MRIFGIQYFMVDTILLYLFKLHCNMEIGQSTQTWKQSLLSYHYPIAPKIYYIYQNITNALSEI